jgi:hypothetical protein
MFSTPAPRSSIIPLATMSQKWLYNKSWGEGEKGRQSSHEQVK